MIGYRPPGYANGGMSDDGTWAPGYANGGAMGFRPLGYANGGMPRGYQEGGEAVPSDVLAIIQELKRITDTGSTQALQAFVMEPGRNADLRVILENFPQFRPVIGPILDMFPPAPGPGMAPEQTGNLGRLQMMAPQPPIPQMRPPPPQMPPPQMPPPQMPMGPNVQGMNRGGIMSLRHM